ncbi:MAG: hypothetical protein WC413_03315 [Candidatus Nanoarchaeia archaeon]
MFNINPNKVSGADQLKNSQDLKEKAFAFIRKNGPVLPIQVGKEIGRDTFYASAFLSDLVRSKKVLFTNAKFGGSPLYYVIGQEHKIQTLYKHLKEKEREAFDLLKQKLVLRDKEMQPAIRVALREIKDFAIPIDVNDNDITERFWKWYMYPDSEAKSRIMSNLGVKEEKIVEKEVEKELPKEIIQEIKQEVKKEEPIIEEKIKKPKVERKKNETKVIEKGEFEEKVLSFLKDHEIDAMESKIIKKGKESNYIVKVPTKIGNMTFFAKAQNKKKLSIADISLAFNEAAQSNLPLLYITNGEPTKKIQEYIEKQLRNRVIIKTL